MRATIKGEVSTGFSRVEEVFYDNFRKRGEIGASCSVFIDNEKVVDLWGGFADAARRRPWDRNTKTLVFSSTKGMSSLAFATLHSKGLVDFDSPVALYWPEFAQNGKENITVRQLLAHEAGLFAIDKMLDIPTLRQKDKLAGILAAQRPDRKAIGRKAYHTWTIALYLSELAHRIDPVGRYIGTLFSDEVARPLEADFHIGIPTDAPESEMADIVPFNPLTALVTSWNRIPFRLVFDFMNPLSMPSRSFINPPVAVSPLVFKQRFLRELEIGSATGVGTARSMARIYGEFACGAPRLGISAETISELERLPDNPNNGRKDLVLKENLVFSLGLEKPSDFFRFGSDSRAYGHQGAGGSAGFADPDKRLGFSYVMNRMGVNVANDPREKALRDAIYSIL